MKFKGSFEYSGDAENLFLKCVNIRLRERTIVILRRFNRKNNSNMHFQTALRILKKLENDGRVESNVVGKSRFWKRKKNEVLKNGRL